MKLKHVLVSLSIICAFMYILVVPPATLNNQKNDYEDYQYLLAKQMLYTAGRVDEAKNLPLPLKGIAVTKIHLLDLGETHIVQGEPLPLDRVLDYDLFLTTYGLDLDSYNWISSIELNVRDATRQGMFFFTNHDEYIEYMGDYKFSVPTQLDYETMNYPY